MPYGRPKDTHYNVVAYGGELIIELRPYHSNFAAVFRCPECSSKDTSATWRYDDWYNEYAEDAPEYLSREHVWWDWTCHNCGLHDIPFSNWYPEVSVPDGDCAICWYAGHKEDFHNA